MGEAVTNIVVGVKVVIPAVIVVGMFVAAVVQEPLFTDVDNSSQTAEIIGYFPFPHLKYQ